MSDLENEKEWRKEMWKKICIIEKEIVGLKLFKVKVISLASVFAFVFGMAGHKISSFITKILGN